MGLILPVTELNDREIYQLKGKVKSVMEIKYALDEGSDNLSNQNIIYQKFILFDQNGYEQEIILYKNGEVSLESKFVSGSDGKQVAMNEYLQDGTLNLNVTYKYDEKGLRSEAEYNWSENRVIGEICEMVDYYDDIIKNEIFSTVQYKYEYRGYCIEKNYLKPDGNPSFKITAKYDFNGNKLESAYFHGNGTLSWITKYKYDRYDNLIESRVFKSNRIAVLSEYKYQYDFNGNWISRKEDREVHINILTAGLNQSDMITERTIEYY